jgi:F-type H+-transporting ATPase subunit a
MKSNLLAESIAAEESQPEEQSIDHAQPVGADSHTPGETEHSDNNSIHAATTENSHSEQSGGGHHIVLAPETLTHIGPFPITNTMITSWLVMLTIIAVSFLATKNMKRIPTGVQNFMEMVIESFHNLSKDLSPDKVKYFFPFIMTFFLFIVTANWFGLLPGVMTITTQVDGHTVPLIRPVNTDLNMTLGLAIISIAVTHYFAVKFLGVGGYLKKWFSLNPIMLFVGILELVSEFTKMISLSFRLFGNIFAGEVVLTTISGLFAFIAPLPFYLLEVLVGVVQAAVFMMLTLVFMVVLSDKHDAH